MKVRVTHRYSPFPQLRFSYKPILLILAFCLFLHPQAVARNIAFPQKSLSLEDRIELQTRIEKVYWKHRLWPEENSHPKPSFDEYLNRETLQAKVKESLQKSNALQFFWHRPLRPEQIQAEINRITNDTKDPDLLRELWEILDNKPTLVAEGLVRPIIADHLLRSWYAFDWRFHGRLRRQIESELNAYRKGVVQQLSGERLDINLKSESSIRLPLTQVDQIIRKKLTPGVFSTLLEDSQYFYVISPSNKSGYQDWIMVRWRKAPFDSWWKDVRNAVPGQMMDSVGSYNLPQIRSSLGCMNEKWTATEVVPPSVTGYKSLWTGTEMIAWGGTGDYRGFRYNPDIEKWTPINSWGQPTKRELHSVVWTGYEVIVWGGYDPNLNVRYGDGAAYNPATDTWRDISNNDAPSPRAGHVSVWNGNKMLVWGGFDGVQFLGTGSVYDVAQDEWQPMSSNMAPMARAGATAVWTGNIMVVWGGSGISGVMNTGARYNPIQDSWEPTELSSAPTARDEHTAVWTGSEMIVWGGYDGNQRLNTGGRYNPASDSWIPITTANAPTARSSHTAVWTGSQMIVWGGRDSPISNLADGGRYDPLLDAWASVELINAPTARYAHEAVWTGTEMLIWAGYSSMPLNTGARYNPVSDSWTPIGLPSSPGPRADHVAVWTGTEMFVFGGEGATDDGGTLYTPVIDRWTPASIVNAPETRSLSIAVWTGVEAIVWGGQFGGTIAYDTGGRYNPASDTWQPTSTVNVPSARYGHVSVWSGSYMVVWGGTDISGQTLQSGGRYIPSTDSWIGVNTMDSRTPGERDTAVWTGSDMIVWGGIEGGGRYDPQSDTWQPISLVNSPPPRSKHSGVWTGTEMIVWGGEDSTGFLSDGGRYNPSTDSWTYTSLTGSPSARRLHGAIWNGTHMIIWGGEGENGSVGSGALYDPSTDSWGQLTDQNAPTSRFAHTTIWTGLQMIVWGGFRYIPFVEDTGGLYGCNTLFYDNFDDDASDWIFQKGQWSVSLSYLIGTSNRKARALAPFSGCSLCTIESNFQTDGGTGSKTSLLGWYQDKKNNVELVMKEDSDKWVLKQRVAGTVVAKAKILQTIDAGVAYLIRIRFNGSQFEVWVDDTLSLTMPKGVGTDPQGGAGFQIKATTTQFDFMLIYL